MRSSEYYPNGYPHRETTLERFSGTKKTFAAKGHTDGFGAQYLAHIRAVDKAFREDSSFAFIGFSDGEHHLSGGEANEFSGLTSFSNSAPCPGPYCEVTMEGGPFRGCHTKTLEFAKKAYDSTSKSGASCTGKIAVHYRRGDILKKDHDQSEAARRKINEAVLIRGIKKIMRKHPGLDVVLVSEGNPNDFVNIKRGIPGIAIHLGKWQDAFHCLATADVTVVGKSSAFSDSAAVINYQNPAYRITDKDVRVLRERCQGGSESTIWRL